MSGNDDTGKNTRHRPGAHLQLKGTKALPPEAAFWDLDVRLVIDKLRLKKNLWPNLTSSPRGAKRKPASGRDSG